MNGGAPLRVWRGFCASFLLQARMLARGRLLGLLLVLAAAAVVLLPRFLRTDGTAAGARELALRTTLGTVFAVTAVAALAAACGAFAHERRTHRLALTLVRPVPALAVGLGRLSAIVSAAAVVLSFAAILTAAALLARGPQSPCRRLVAPSMPTPVEEAEAAYAHFMRDRSAPKDVKKADRATVIAELAERASERYDIVPAGGKASWNFELPSGEACAARFRFSAEFGLRVSVAGVFRLDDCAVTVSNLTQNVVEIPFPAGSGRAAAGRRMMTLTFENKGATSVMLRPRKDLFILLPGDAFGWNLVRAVLELLVVITLLAALGLFLSAALSRPVALFTAMVLVAVTLMAPSVLTQFPSELGGPLPTRVGLRISRTILRATQGVGELRPLAALAEDEFIEWRELGRAAAINAVLFPLLLLLLAGIVLRYRPAEAD